MATNKSLQFEITNSENAGFDIDGMWLKKPEIIKQFIDQRSDYEKLCAEVAYILTNIERTNNLWNGNSSVPVRSSTA